MHRARLHVTGSILLLSLALLAGSSVAFAATPGTNDGTTHIDGSQVTGSHQVRQHFYSADACLRAVAAGVGVRAASSPTTGGIITLPPGPALGNIVWAGLYWSTLGDQPPVNNVSLNAVPVVPQSLGVSASPCWPQAYAFTYFADVTGLVDAGANIVRGLDDSGIPNSGYSSEGAGLVVVYRDASSSACEIIVMDGNILNAGLGNTDNVPLPVTCGAGLPSKLTFLGGDGQAASDNQLWNGVPIGDGDDFDNSDPQTGGAFTVGWDTDSWGVVTAAANVAGVTSNSDCVNWLATVLEVGARPTPPCEPTNSKKGSWGSVKIRYR